MSGWVACSAKFGNGCAASQLQNGMGPSEKMYVTLLGDECGSVTERDGAQ